MSVSRTHIYCLFESQLGVINVTGVFQSKRQISKRLLVDGVNVKGVEEKNCSLVVVSELLILDGADIYYCFNTFTVVVFGSLEHFEGCLRVLLLLID